MKNQILNILNFFKKPENKKEKIDSKFAFFLAVIILDSPSLKIDIIIIDIVADSEMNAMESYQMLDSVDDTSELIKIILTDSFSPFEKKNFGENSYFFKRDLSVARLLMNFIEQKSN